jgi:hypothetical protein
VTHGGRELVRRLRFAGRSLVIEVVNIARTDDAACCGSASARLVYRWDAKRAALRLSSRRTYTERSAASRLIAAVRRGSRRAAVHLASAGVVSDLFRLRKTSRLSLRRCVGMLSSDYWVAGAVAGTSRSCLVTTKTRRGGHASAYALDMAPPTWNTWRARALRGVAG